MSKKMFCDICDAEIMRNVVSERVKENTVYRGTKVDVEIVVGMSGTWNDGDLCKSCLFGVLDHFDPRAKAAMAA